MASSIALANCSICARLETACSSLNVSLFAKLPFLVLRCVRPQGLEQRCWLHINCSATSLSSTPASSTSESLSEGTRRQAPSKSRNRHRSRCRSIKMQSRLPRQQTPLLAESSRDRYTCPTHDLVKDLLLCVPSATVQEQPLDDDPAKSHRQACRPHV